MKLKDYKYSRRDDIVVGFCNFLLRHFATKGYMNLLNEAIRRGLTQMITEESPNPPFTEPLDD